MLKPGLVSVTFRKKSPAEIIKLVKDAGLAGIEWGGDIHVPHGKVDTAKEVLRLTRGAGLTVAAYGSYFTLGKSEAEGLSFKSVLDTAVALEAPVIRVWPGPKASEKTDEETRKKITDECRTIGGLAAKAGKVITFEFHNGSLTDTPASTARLIKETGKDSVRTYWQPALGETDESRLAGLRTILPWLVHVHVFHWLKKDKDLDQRPLAEGAESWTKYIEVLRTSGRDHFLMLEFVKGDAAEAFIADAAELKRLIGK
jgi:3-dehydroshikimate dehydratase